MNMKTSAETRMKNFKKKYSNLSVEVPTSAKQGGDKLTTLKQKLQKQKKMMEKTGKRFREEASNSVSTQQISIQTQPIKNNQENIQKNSISVEVGTTELPMKQSMSLSQIQLGNEKKSYSLASSKVFEKEIQSQKKRSKELWNFLKKVELQQFTDALIESGFDDLDILMEITTEDLNHIMMRARQQDILMGEIKNRKGNIKEEPVVPLSQNPSILRVKTQPRPATSQSSYPHLQTQPQEIMTERKNFKKKKDVMEEDNKNIFMKTSFLFTAGGKNWSVDDQIRRACSGCFKMSTQMQKKGDCYYCTKCFELLAGDLLTLSLDTSLSRSYKKL